MRPQQIEGERHTDGDGVGGKQKIKFGPDAVVSLGKPMQTMQQKALHQGNQEYDG